MPSHRGPRLRRIGHGFASALALCALHAASANPLHLISETYSDWKHRLFGSGHPLPDVIDAPAKGDIALPLGQPMRIHIDQATPEREFPKGSSRFRMIELPATLAHASVRVQVIAEHNETFRGNAVFKPALYVIGDDGKPRGAVEAKPLHLDIRPLRRTRLLGCVTLDDVRRFALATTADAFGKSYDSDVRDSIKADSSGGYYYTTDAVKVMLPYAATGTLVIDVADEASRDKGC